MSTWDVVVVGGGGSGAVLASRLSEDPSRRVLLLEAGPAPTQTSGFPPELLEGGRLIGANPAHPDTWSFPAHLAPTRPYSVVRGRILGGSTTTNGGYFVRPRREDADRWSRVGSPTWSWPALLPFLRALERDLDYGESTVHGGSGPVPVRRPPVDHPAAAAFRAAALDLGHPAEVDGNDQGPGGVGAVPSNTVDGVRVNTGLAYVLPALARPNLTVRGGARVLRVVVEHGAATGVLVQRGTGTEVVRAGEVVLAAGAIASPHLLLLSGVGPSAQLQRAGVDVVQDAPVGAFGDHPQVVLQWRPRPGLPPAPTGTWMGAALHTASTTGPTCGDLEVLQSLVPLPTLLGAPPYERAALPLLVSVQSPVRSGRMALVSTDPFVPPSLDYGYLATGTDRARLREAVRAAGALLATGAFAVVSEGPLDLDARVLDDDGALDAWVAAHLGTSVHTCASAPLGGADDPGAVVDPGGRVHGVDGLRVGDTSILPDAPLRGPALSAVLVGEVVADAVVRGH